MGATFKTGNVTFGAERFKSLKDALDPSSRSVVAPFSWSD
jgi:hypothetical protein